MNIGENSYIPDEFMYQGMCMSESMTPIRTLERLQAGEGPHYDVLIATYPRSGTVRLIETAWLILHNCDVETSRSVDLGLRYLFLEMCDPTFTSCYRGLLDPLHQPLKVAKTHLNFHIMKEHVERGVKVIVGMRNPKDTLMSNYHFMSKNKWYGPMKKTFKEFFQYFKNNRLQFGDMFDFYESWWTQRDRANILIAKYEDYTRNPVQEVERIAKFLGVQLDQHEVEAIAKWTTFRNMKQEDTLNFTAYVGNTFEDTDSYLRKGHVGDWQQHLDQHQSQYIDEKYKERCVPIGLTFDFE